ncbi:MAG TPA: DNA translocase FtsK 4TM domain-containing protein [Actinomycetota bacterium]|nr:DNA translocase FtsK 4TM domain-containing protein [Actinomycetota bacterium]
MARTINRQRHDVSAALAIFLAVIAGLGLFADSAGPVGHGTAWALRALIGWCAPVLPFLLVYVGVQAIRTRTEDAGRVAVGGLVTLVGVAALRQVLFAHDAAGLRVEELGKFGGVLGAGVAWPLERAISPWGAGIFALMLVVLGLLVTTHTPLHTAAARTHAAILVTARGIAVASRVTSREVARAGRWARPRLLTLMRWRPGGAQPAPLESGSGPILEISQPRPERGRTIRLDDLPGVEEVAQAGAAGIPLPVPVPTDDAQDRSWVQPPLPRDPKQAEPAEGYRTPPPELLSISEATTRPERTRAAIEETVRVLERTLAEFLVDAHVTGFTPGPTVTRYEVELGPAVKVNRVVGLQNEIRYALAAGELRILAPIPGRSAIGIEVPNQDRHVVTLGDVLRSNELKALKHPLTVGLGKDISGTPVGVSLADMPHLLIAGATGSGKSTCINSMLISILARARPDQVRLLLIDPKWVELSQFNGVPHLLTPVVTSPKKAAEALAWVVKEMDARYEVLAMAGMRNADMYNEAVRSGALGPAFEDGTPRSPYPYYLIVVDELADLMMVAPREVEESICRIAQKARAVGIHLLVATQRPSVDVVTGVIKANIPSRMAFATASLADSRVILDEAGADRLIGHGDMLYKHASAARPRRLQGTYVSEAEIESVIGWCRRQRNVDYIEGVVSEATQRPGSTESDEDEALLRQALELVVSSRLGSTSMLQRKLKVGFSRAGRLMDLLEQRGVVGMSQGSKPREVLMTYEEWQEEEAARKASARDVAAMAGAQPPVNKDPLGLHGPGPGSDADDGGEDLDLDL